MALSAPWRTALGLAKYKGLPVLPCMPDKKLPLTKHGCYSASTDEKKIRKWAEHYPDALIAVPTGAVSGLVAIDVDPGGAQWYAENSAELACGRIHTTRRGWHLLYRQPQGVIVPSVRDVPVPGVDVRGTGGYIIWWPAHLGVSKDTVTGELDDVTNLPPWLEQQIAKPAHSTRGSGGADDQAGPLDHAAQVELLARAEQLLARLDPGCNRDLWVKVGMGLHYETRAHAAGRVLWDRWSRGELLPEPRRPGNYDPVELGRQWGSFKLDHAAPVTFGTLVHLVDEYAPPGLIDDELVLPSSAWPAPLAESVYHGLAGEIVRTISPESEADPAALLMHLLVAFGVLAGRHAHYYVEGARHHSNLFACIVGETAKGRKGTSWARLRQIFERVLVPVRVVSGLSTGEGLKFNVRDPREGTERDKKTGHIETFIADAGVGDKRLLVIEPEFAQSLRVVQRPGNTLSPTVRDSWDTGDLMTLTKADPVTATGAHIGMLTHITIAELRAELGATHLASGFGNRFLFVCARRSKVLPFGGGETSDQVLGQFASKLDQVADNSRKRGRISMAPGARELWESVYQTLSAGAPGLFGAATARAEAQSVRLALLYSMLDDAPAIERVHLEAALELWRYCADSARLVFGDALGDRVADDILRGLRRAGDVGMNRTDISALLGRHESVERIGAALVLLAEQRLAWSEQRSTGGRPVEVWRAGKPAK